MASRSDQQRPSVYINPTLARVRDRARHAGESLTGELTHAMARYDALAAMNLADIEPDQLAALRCVLAGQPRLPLAWITPRLLSALVESAAAPEREPRQSLRAVYAVARHLARLSPGQCVALVETTERWLRRPDSRQADHPADELFVAR